MAERIHIPSPEEIRKESSSLDINKRLEYLTDLAERYWPSETTLAIYKELHSAAKRFYRTAENRETQRLNQAGKALQFLAAKLEKPCYGQDFDYLFWGDITSPQWFWRRGF